jgi:S1-C subfamily serine protease
MCLSPESARTQGRVSEVIKATASLVKISRPLDVEEGEPEKTYICTGVVVPDKVVVTARHCVGNRMLVNGAPTALVKVDNELALVTLPVGVEVPPIKIASGVKIGEPVIASGYGDNILMSLQRHVAFFIDGDIATDGAFVHGMSGGPIVNSKGELVGIIQRANEVVGLGCGFQEVKDFLK